MNAAVLTVDFCGEEYAVAPGRTLVAGRDAELVIDDNAYLHRRMVEFAYERGYWWIRNIGSRLAVTVCAEAGRMQSWVGPGHAVPVVLPELAVLFSAGATTYELLVRTEVAVFEPLPAAGHDDASNLTLGSVSLTPAQYRLLVALAEPTLRRAGTGSSVLPSNAEAARRLGWSVTTFNRKLDNVCDKFDRAGVHGMRGGPGALATGRRGRLVEYVVAARIVTAANLPLLDAAAEPANGVSV